ncbi:Unknown protein, partial [Striga hermonthica]
SPSDNGIVLVLNVHNFERFHDEFRSITRIAKSDGKVNFVDRSGDTAIKSLNLVTAWLDVSRVQTHFIKSFHHQDARIGPGINHDPMNRDPTYRNSYHQGIGMRMDKMISVFDGDPRIVDEWIQGLEFIFKVMECPDRYRVVCAQLQLTGDARLWWNAYWSMRPGEKAGCTWDMFKDLVCDKYYPSYYRAEMERQFLALQQGTRTVDEYEREFTRLAGFAPDLVRTEAQRAQRFIDGLYPAVRHNI